MLNTLNRSSPPWARDFGRAQDLRTECVLAIDAFMRRRRLARQQARYQQKRQRVNHLKGSGNNIHGKTVSANAKAKHLNKNH